MAFKRKKAPRKKPGKVTAAKKQAPKIAWARCGATEEKKSRKPRASTAPAIIRETRTGVESRKEQYEKTVNTLNKLLSYQQCIFGQLQIINQAEKSLIWKLLK
jgi:hypothetical protein